MVSFSVGYCNNNSVSGNNITNNEDGIMMLSYSSDNSVSGNNIVNSFDGIRLDSSSNNSLSGNNITANNGDGIHLAFSNSNNTISGNNITANNYDGIALESSSNNSVSGNNITNNTYHGISIISSSDNNVSGNNITDNTYYGVDFVSSNDSSVSGNNITDSGCGIYISSSSSNTVSGNNITDNTYYGIFLSSYNNNNTVSGNNIANNGCGTGIFPYSNNNTICHNNFTNNTSQVYSSDSTNVWDDSYPSGGNYWSNYKGTDLYNAQFQNETGSDGIGDTPYAIDASNQDNYPLMRPYVPFDNQTIYIRADGSIDPSGAPILRKGDLYALTGNITSSSDGIVIERDDVTLDGAGYILQGCGSGRGIDLSGRTGVSVHNTEIGVFSYGIYLESSMGNSITSNNVTETRPDGISVGYSSGNNISNNIIANNGGFAVHLWGSSNSAICGNCMTNNYEGIVFYASTSNTVYGNNITNNFYGIDPEYYSDNNIFYGNNIANNNCSVLIFYSSENVVYENNIANNYIGVWFISSSNNTFYHDNFSGNTRQVVISGGANGMDCGYPSGGNYWSDYNGADLYNGPFQNQTGGDGIGDTPCTFDSNDVDNYPLMGPFSSLYSNATQASISCISNSTVTGFQQRGDTISFDVSGEPSTTGFCTVTIPHSTLLPPYTIEVDCNQVSYTTLMENDKVSIIYFTYQHSTHEVTITGESALPWITLEGPYYTEYGIEYWILRPYRSHAFRLLLD